MAERDELTAYVTHGMDPRSRELFEERFFSDDAIFDQLSSVEAELMESYLDGRLARDQATGFERHLRNNPRTRQRLQFLRMLRSGVSPVYAKSARAGLRWAAGFAAAFLLVSGATVYLFLDNRELRKDLIASVDSSRSTAPNPAAQTIDPVQNVSLHATAVTRDSGHASLPTLIIRPNASVLALVVRVPASESVRLYSASLLNADGQEVAAHRRIVPELSGDLHTLTALFPVRVLTRGSWVLQVRDSRGSTQRSFTFNLLHE